MTALTLMGGDDVGWRLEGRRIGLPMARNMDLNPTTILDPPTQTDPVTLQPIAIWDKVTFQHETYAKDPQSIEQHQTEFATTVVQQHANALRASVYWPEQWRLGLEPTG